MSDLYFNLTLPFHVGSKAGSDSKFDLSKDNKDLALRRLPFSLYIDENYLLPRLHITSAVEASIAEAYANSSMISSPLGTSVLANDRMNEVLACLKSVAKSKFIDKTFVEIGSGTGHLLSAVRDLGANVVGFEIGPQGFESIKQFDLKIINDYFDTKYLTGTVDCIFSSGCLEHIIDLDHFVKNSIEALNPGGLFFHSVPNSLTHFEKGGIEGLIHEHINYFTPENAIRFLHNIGLTDCGVSLNNAGNELFLWGYKSHKYLAEPSMETHSTEFVKQKNNLIRYEKILKDNLSRRISRLQNLVHCGHRKIGFYGGGAQICFLANIEKDARFFDGDDSKWGHTWFPSLSAIENPMNLALNPVDDLVICVEHYADAILHSLRDQKLLDKTITVHLLSDL
tara:strand:+ start:337 stop:1524 length:1188 start_codon:yes stop_codon:yes gene_type:complete